MRSKIVSFKTLEKEKRWNLNFLLDSGKKYVSSEYPLVSLYDIAYERKTFLTPQDYSEHVFNYVGLENIESNTGFLVDFEPRLGSSILSRCKVFFKDDVLYGRLRPTLNKVILVDEKLIEGICTTEIIVMMAKKDVVRPLVLQYFLLSDHIQSQVKVLTGGAALPRIHQEDLFSMKIHLPPLEKQIEMENYLINSINEYKNVRNKSMILPKSMLSSISNFVNTGSVTDNYVQDNIYDVVWNNSLPTTKEKASKF